MSRMTVLIHCIKDARFVAAATAIPLILALAGVIVCGTAILNQSINVSVSIQGLVFQIQETVTIGFRQIRLQVAGFQSVDATTYIKQACPNQPTNQTSQNVAYPCIGSVPGDSSDQNICILPTSFASFAASQVFAAFAITLQVAQPALVMLLAFKKVHKHSFTISSCAIIVFLIISVCCAALGAQKFEDCLFQLAAMTAPSSASYSTQLLPGANNIIAAIFFQFFIWT